MLRRKLLDRLAQIIPSTLYQAYPETQLAGELVQYLGISDPLLYFPSECHRYQLNEKKEG